MSQKEMDFCFCTLAMGKRYRLLAKQLAQDLKKYSHGTTLVVFTDRPKDLRNCDNVLAYRHCQQHGYYPHNDKRFVIEKALSLFRAAIFIDADTRIKAEVPGDIGWSKGITADFENLLSHTIKYNAKDLPKIEKLASKLNLSLEQTQWIGECLFILARDEGREREFIKYWGVIARYFDLKRIGAKDGTPMGLAAAKAGLGVRKGNLEKLKKVCEHMDISYKREHRSFWDNLRCRLNYHYRLNKARLAALRDFNFYYR